MEQKYRIGIEAQRIFRVKKHGMDMVALELIRALQAIDTVNEYYIFTAKGEDTGCIQETSNFRIVQLDMPTYPLWEQIALPRAARKYKCDLLHCTSNTAPIFSSTPVVTTVHDIIYLESWSTFKTSHSWYQKLGHVYRRLVVPSIMNLSRLVFTVSKYEKSVIDNYFPQHTSKVQVLYNACGKHFSTKEIVDEGSLRQKYQLPSEYIFYIGNTDPKKNTKNVIKAYAEYIKQEANPLQLVMPDFDMNLFKSYIPSALVDTVLDNTVFTGYIPNEHLPVVYKNASLFLYPSIRESFGIPILEAMACGTPVLTANTSAMPEIGGVAAEYVDPNDVSSITKTMRRILDSQENRDRMRNAGLAQVAKFDWKRSAETLHDAYIELLTPKYDAHSMVI